MSRYKVFLSILLACSGFCVQSAERMLSEKESCSILRERIAVHDGVPAKLAQKTWFCDISSDTDSHWVVIGLRSYRQCEGICSNLRGWFAVNRQTGRVHEFNVADMEIGPPFSERPDQHNKGKPKDGTPLS